MNKKISATTEYLKKRIVLFSGIVIFIATLLGNLEQIKNTFSSFFDEDVQIIQIDVLDDNTLDIKVVNNGNTTIYFHEASLFVKEFASLKNILTLPEIGGSSEMDPADRYIYPDIGDGQDSIMGISLFPLNWDRTLKKSLNISQYLKQGDADRFAIKLREQYYESYDTFIELKVVLKYNKRKEVISNPIIHFVGNSNFLPNQYTIKNKILKKRFTNLQDSSLQKIYSTNKNIIGKVLLSNLHKTIFAQKIIEFCSN